VTNCFRQFLGNGVLISKVSEVSSYYRPRGPLRESSGVALLFSLNLGTLDGGGWSTPRPGRFYPGKDQVPIVKEAGWASEPVCIGAENLAPTGIQSPDLPARSELLYRLCHPGSLEF
jgi:hypothetical protein